MGANEASWRDWLWQVGKFGSFKLRINLYRKSQDTIRYDNTLFRVLVFVSFCVALVDSFHLKTIFPAQDCITHEKTFLALICMPVSTRKKKHRNHHLFFNFMLRMLFFLFKEKSPRKSICYGNCLRVFGMGVIVQFLDCRHNFPVLNHNFLETKMWNHIEQFMSY